MVKRRVRTGFEDDAMSKMNLGVKDQSSIGEGLDAAGKGIASDDSIADQDDVMQHYFDIGKLMAAGEDASGMPEGPLDDEIENAMGFGEGGQFGEEIADIAGLDENENLADSIGYGEQDQGEAVGMESPVSTDEDAQGLAGLDIGMAGEETPSGEGETLIDAHVQDNDVEETAPREKGEGFFGRIPATGEADYDYSTEISIGVDIDGEAMEIPALVPTLTIQEINHLAAGGEPTPEIVEKAVSYARQRMAEGKDPFAQPGEQMQLPEDEEAVIEEETEDIVEQPEYVPSKEALQNPDIRRVIETDSGLQLTLDNEKQIEAYDNIINGNAAEDEAAAKRMEDLSRKMEAKDMSKMDMVLLGAALLIPTMFAAKEGGAEAMMAAIGKGLEGGVEALKLGIEQRQAYGKELTDVQKQHAESQAKRGKVTEEFLQTIPEYPVKKELQGKETYTDDEGNVGVGFGAPNVYFDKSAIYDVKDIEAMRKAQPKIKEEINTTYKVNRIAEDLSDTLIYLQESGGEDPTTLAKALTKFAPAKFGTKAHLGGKEITLEQQLRSQLKEYTTVMNVPGETRYSTTLVDTAEEMLKDPTKAILSTTLNDLLVQVEEAQISSISNLSSFLNLEGVLLEPVWQGYERITPRREYEPTDKQIIAEFENVPVKEAKRFKGLFEDAIKEKPKKATEK
jgi:hypothetical protein